LVHSGGLALLVTIVFSETGLLVGFFLPGDSLLVTAGIFAASDGMGGPGLFSLATLLGSLSAAAIMGDQVGYVLGSRTGHLISRRPDSLLFKQKHLKAAHDFYEKYGPRAIILARFVPIFRTFVPFAAGMAGMKYSTYLRFDIVGGILWICSMILLGYFLGRSPLADQLHKVILVVIFVSVIPIVASAARGIALKRRQKSL
jgi:membrane-associated protein